MAIVGSKARNMTLNLFFKIFVTRHSLKNGLKANVVFLLTPLKTVTSINLMYSLVFNLHK